MTNIKLRAGLSFNLLANMANTQVLKNSRYFHSSVDENKTFLINLVIFNQKQGRVSWSNRQG
jgi:hypothetical protein